jgi:hypothetical protein
VVTDEEIDAFLTPGLLPDGTEPGGPLPPHLDPYRCPLCDRPMIRRLRLPRMVCSEHGEQRPRYDEARSRQLDALCSSPLDFGFGDNLCERHDPARMAHRLIEDRRG